MPPRRAAPRRQVSTPTATPARHGTGWRAGLGVLLALAMGMGSFTQAALGVLAPAILDDLGLTKSQLGAAASIIYLSAALVARFGGSAIDILGGRRTLFVLFGSAGAAVLAVGTATSFWWIAAASLVAGVAAGVNNPVTNKIIAVHTEPGRQALLVGTKQAGVKLAHFLVGFGLPPLVLWLGWRAAMSSGAVLAAVGLGVALWLLPAERMSAPDRRRQIGDAAGVGRQILWLRIYALLMAAGLSAFNTYLPLYAVEAVGFSLTAAGAAAGVAGVVAASSRILWAYVTEHVGHPPGWLALLSLGGLACVAVLATATARGDIWLWVGAVGVSATAGTWAVVGQFTVIRENRREAGRASGFLQAAFLIGMAIGAPVFGVLVDRFGSYTPGWAVVGVLWTVAAVVAGWELRRRLSSQCAPRGA